jgi:hypothetical protein
MRLAAITGTLQFAWFSVLSATWNLHRSPEFWWRFSMASFWITMDPSDLEKPTAWPESLFPAGLPWNHLTKLKSAPCPRVDTSWSAMQTQFQLHFFRRLTLQVTTVSLLLYLRSFCLPFFSFISFDSSSACCRGRLCFWPSWSVCACPHPCSRFRPGHACYHVSQVDFEKNPAGCPTFWSWAYRPVDACRIL